MTFSLRSLTCAAIVASAVLSFPAQAQDLKSPFWWTSLFAGPSDKYIRMGVGVNRSSFGDSSWRSPGPSDPRVYFNLSDDNATAFSAAYGLDWDVGIRGEVAFTYFGKKDVAGPWAFTVPASAGPHANMSTTVRSAAVMGNLIYEPLKFRGNTSNFQPFVIGGLGLASNRMGNWTRTNPAATRVTRTFAGASHRSLAWNVGIGGSWKIKRKGQTPITFDVMYQYFDLGKAKGSSTLVAGGGASVPRSPLEFDVKSQVVSFGVRIPLK